MTKLILNATKIVLVLLSALFFASCNIQIDGLNSIEGSQNVTSVKRDVTENFTYVEAATGLDVEIIQQEKAEITVIADDNLHEHIETSISNGVLKLKFTHSVKDAASKKIIVGMPICNGLSTSSGAFLETKDKMKGQKIDLSTSSGSEMKVLLEYDEVNADASSGSEMIVSGLNLNARFESSSGSEINAENLIANDVIAESSSGSEITVQPVLSLEAEASSGSEIKYVKTPEKISIRKSSGGSVVPK